MIHLPLQLIRHSRPQGPVAAAFLPGTQPESWARGLAVLNVGEDTPLWPLPRAADDPQCIGLLVPLAGTGEITLPTDLHALPYRQVGGLYLPCCAALSPALLPEEFAPFFGHPEQGEPWIFHPGAGLVRFEARDALRVSQLLQRPKCRDIAWNKAHPGILFAERLAGLSAMLSPPSPSFLEQFRPEKDEQEEEGNKGAASRFRKMVGMDKDQPPDLRPDQPSQKFDGEINRLLDMLKSDPDKGLRHAIPLRGLFRGRGVQNPSNPKLRDKGPVRFHLGRLFGQGKGGGPASVWNVRSDLQTQLNAAYHETAKRELELGRYGRAAYIFGELLGDLSSAANALEQGRLYREAAQIHKRLNKGVKAAECLQRGGYLEEAAELYEEHQCHVEAGRLYRKLGRDNLADEMFWSAVLSRRNRRQTVEACKLLVEELNERDAALNDLEEHVTENDCCEYYFKLVGEEAEHERASRTLRELRHQDGAPLESLVNLARTYPDRAIREQARRVGRAIISESINHDNKRHWGRLLRNFHPEDKLLGRDLDRLYRITTGPSPAPVRQEDVEELAREAYTRKPIPPIMRYGACFVGATLRGSGSAIIHLLGGAGKRKDVVLGIQNPMNAPLVVATNPDGQRQIIFGGLDVGSFHVPQTTEQFSGRSFTFGSPAWLPSGLLAMQMTDRRTLVALSRTYEHGLRVLRYKLDGSLLQVIPIEERTMDRLAVSGKQIWVGGSAGLTCLNGRGSQAVHINLPGVEQLFVHGDILIANTENGADLIPTDPALFGHPNQHLHRFADLAVCLLPRHVIARDGHSLYVFSTHQKRVKRVCKLDLIPEEIRGHTFSATEKPNEFVVIGGGAFRRIRFRT